MANQAELAINILLGADKLKFEPTADGRRASFAIARLVFDDGSVWQAL